MVKYTFLLLLVLLGSSDEYVRAFLSSSKPVILSAMKTMMSPLITTTLRSMVNNNAATESKVTFLALTREVGKNEKLRLQLEKNCDNTTTRTVEVEVFELPCIEHGDGPDYTILASTLLSKRWDYVAITSPEAAKVLGLAWDVVRSNPIPVAAVGKATESSLRDLGIPVTFVPSKSTAATLANELELLDGEQPTSVLYPASAKAKNVLENGLVSRGFTVKRLNTYDTVTAAWRDDQKALSEKVQVACFGSPSAVKGWLKNTQNNTQVFAACIGHTSASACKELGWTDDKIFFPETPGLDGWVGKTLEAARSVHNEIDLNNYE